MVKGLDEQSFPSIFHCRWREDSCRGKSVRIRAGATFSRNASSGAKPASSQLPNESASSEVITCIRTAGHVFHFLRERERGATDERERGATDENASQVSQSALSSIGAWEP
jgi:hypothetical protein